MENFQEYFNKELNCINVIHEFLIHYEFTSTIPVFIDEARMLGFPVEFNHNLNNDDGDDKMSVKSNVKHDNIILPLPHIKRDDITKIITSFESKNYKLFFELWQTLIPSSVKESNVYRELTFYLYVYFATLPFRQSENNNETNNRSTYINHDQTDKNVNKENHNDKNDSIVVNIKSNNNDKSNKEENNEYVMKKKNDKMIKIENNLLNNNNNNNNNNSSNVKEIVEMTDKEKNIEEIIEKHLITVEKENSINKITVKDKSDNVITEEDIDEDIDNKMKKIDNDENDNDNDIPILKIINRKKNSDGFDEDSLNISMKDETNQNSEEELEDYDGNDRSKEDLKYNDDKNSKNDEVIDLNNLNDKNIKENGKQLITMDHENEKEKQNQTELNVISDEIIHSENEVIVNNDDDNNNIDNGENEKDSNETAMDVLKKFLTTKGPEFSSEPDFLPYFALPFISNPRTHPSFMEIFKESWASNMEQRLIDFIQQYSYGNTVTPSLMRLYPNNKTNSKTNEENNISINKNDEKPTKKVLQKRSTTPVKIVSSPQAQDNTDSNRRYKNIKWKFQKLHRDHQNLIGVAAELTAALENSVRGQAVDIKATLNNCVKIFPELFSKTRLNTGEDNVKKDVRVPYPQEEMPCYHLDVQKIKQHLATGSIKAKLLLLQAVRWRLTRTTGEERDQTVLWISQHDVLSIKYGGQCPVLEEMLITPGTCTPHPLQQAAARLLNTIASLRCGRDYLAPSNRLLSLLVTTLRQDNVRIDQSTADMLLATLQKLSLRKNQRLWMIEEGVVQWLIEKMKLFTQPDVDRPGVAVVVGAYTLEYSTALLMNLCLHDEARQLFPPASISVLIYLLDTPHIQIVPVVTGTIYCLLTRDDINQVAKEYDIEKTILRLIHRFNNDVPLVRQLETLLRLHKRQLNVDSLPAVSEDHNEDEMDDPEELEQELDLNDPVRAMPGDLSGDDLLNRLYSCPTSVHGTTAASDGAASMMSL